MRDPLGLIKIEKTEIKRSLFNPLDASHFLNHSLARELVDKEELIPFEIVNPNLIISPKVSFVSYPHEWSDAQLMDAAKLTLKISETIFAKGFELKDASAWNVIFDGCKPKFCDHLSFQKIKTSKWWAFSQFIRHFILPLCLAKYCQLKAHKSFQLFRDGIPPDQARNFLGLKRYFSRYWLITPQKSSSTSEKLRLNQLNIKPIHKNLYSFLDWLLQGVSPKIQNESAWSNYKNTRTHYDKSASQFKSDVIERWIKSIKPEWVTDLGCNTGEFSRLAVNNGSKVIALDLDHECIQDIYLTSSNLPIHPVLVNLDDMTGGRGWANKEFLSLSERLENQADMVMMLALIHHLAISSSIPLDEIAIFCNKLTKKYLILELINENDILVKLLSDQRARNPKDFDMSNQIKAFNKYFEIIERMSIPNTSRDLVLMKKIN